jgi:hypothetical protein
VKVYKVAANNNGTGSLDLKDWQTGTGGTWEYWTVNAGTLAMGTTAPFTCSTPAVVPLPDRQASVASPALTPVWTTMTGRIVPRACGGAGITSGWETGKGRLHLLQGE